MELKDVDLLPYKNQNPWLENTTELTPIQVEDEVLPQGAQLDKTIFDELTLGNKTDLYIDPIKSDKTSGQIENIHYGNFAKQILVAGTDFAKNFFDTFLFAVKNHGSFNDQKDAFNELANESYKNAENMPNLWRTVGMYSFTTRVTKVEIPQPKAMTFDYNVGQYTVRKIKSEWDYSKKSSLTMRIDGLAYYIDAINLLSQNGDISTLDNQKGIEHLSFMGFNKKVAENLKEGTRLDLVVRHLSLSDLYSHNAYLKNAEHSFYRESATQSSLIGMANFRPDNARSMFWVFEDVKFLGWNDGLEFGHNSIGSQELTTDFIYKRLIRVDPMYLENYVGGTAQVAMDYSKVNTNISNDLQLKSNYN